MLPEGGTRNGKTVGLVHVVPRCPFRLPVTPLSRRPPGRRSRTGQDNRSRAGRSRNSLRRRVKTGSYQLVSEYLQRDNLQALRLAGSIDHNAKGKALLKALGGCRELDDESVARLLSLPGPFTPTGTTGRRSSPSSPLPTGRCRAPRRRSPRSPAPRSKATALCRTGYRR